VGNILTLKNFIYFNLLLTLVKFIYSLNYGDKLFDMEWKILYENLVHNFSLSYYKINGVSIPSVYMPPLYAYFLYLFSFFNLPEIFTVQIVLFAQCIMSGISGYVLFRILNNFFAEKYSYLVAIAYILYPLNFYSPSQISSVTLQVFLFNLYLYFFINFLKNKNFIFFGVVSGFLMLIRGEFWLLFFFSIIFLLFKNIREGKKIFYACLIGIIVITPYLVRNYLIFDKLILTKSSGYNLWRGNSFELNINGNSNTLTFSKDLINIENNLINKNQLHLYELYIDDYYYEKAKKNIFENQYLYFIHYIKKFISFSIFNYNSTYLNYFNPLVFIPELIISIFAILGISKNIFSRNRFKALLLVIFFYLILIPVFFILPRYKLFILPVYFIFVAYFFDGLLSKKNFFQKTIQQSK
jgi:hypothetical protein